MKKRVAKKILTAVRRMWIDGPPPYTSEQLRRAVERLGGIRVGTLEDVTFKTVKMLGERVRATFPGTAVFGVGGSGVYVAPKVLSAYAGGRRGLTLVDRGVVAKRGPKSVTFSAPHCPEVRPVVFRW